jgi:hypothetical protein
VNDLASRKLRDWGEAYVLNVETTGLPKRWDAPSPIQLTGRVAYKSHGSYMIMGNSRMELFSKTDGFNILMRNEFTVFYRISSRKGISWRSLEKFNVALGKAKFIVEPRF